MTGTFAGPATRTPAHTNARRPCSDAPRAKGALHGSLAAPWLLIKVIHGHGHGCRGLRGNN